MVTHDELLIDKMNKSNRVDTTSVYYHDTKSHGAFAFCVVCD